MSNELVDLLSNPLAVAPVVAFLAKYWLDLLRLRPVQEAAKRYVPGLAWTNLSPLGRRLLTGLQVVLLGAVPVLLSGGTLVAALAAGISAAAGAKVLNDAPVIPNLPKRAQSAASILTRVK